MNNKTFKTILIFLFSLVVITILINLNIGFIKLGLADFFDGNAQNSQIAELRMNRVLARFYSYFWISFARIFSKSISGTFGSWDNFSGEFKRSFLYLFFSRFYFTRVSAKFAKSARVFFFIDFFKLNL